MAKSKSTETSVDRTVAPKQLLALIADAHQKRDRIQSIAGELGERVKNAIENGHLHRGAFSLMVRLYKMEELKREDFIRQIGLYVDICREGGLFKPEHVGDLVEEAEREAADEAEAAEPESDVRPGFLRGEYGDDVGAKNGAKIAAGIKELRPKASKSVGGDVEGSYKLSS